MWTRSIRPEKACQGNITKDRSHTKKTKPIQKFIRIHVAYSHKSNSKQTLLAVWRKMDKLINL